MKLSGCSALLLVLIAGCKEAPPSGCDDPAGCTEDSSETGDARVEETCAAVQDLMSQHCTSCHGDFAIDGLDLRRVDRLVGVDSRHGGGALLSPGQADRSYLVHKLLGEHLEAGGAGVRMPPSGALEARDIAVITSWIDDGAACADAEPEPPAAEVDPNTLDQGALFVCDGAPSSSPGRLRRIDKHQLRRRVGLERDHTLAANPLEPPGAAAYSSYALNHSLDVATLDLYLDMLPYAGEPWRGDDWWDREAQPVRNGDRDCIYNDAEPTADCVQAFVATYLETAALRRPASADEQARLTDFAVATLADESATGASRDDSIAMITSAAWLHTGALFEEELGESDADAQGRHRLTDMELAAMIARMLSDRGLGASSIYLYDNDLPGDERWTDDGGPHLAGLVEAARDGSIQDPAVAAALLRQYAMGVDPDREDAWIDYGTHSLATRHDRAEAWMADGLDRFFLEWFDVLSFRSGFQDSPNATTGWHDDDALHYQRSLDELRSFEGWSEPEGLMLFTDTIAQVVVGDQDVLARLLTTNDWYLPATGGNQDLSYRLFGLDTPIGASRPERWITLPASERAGLLTHPVWLASHGDAFEDGPSLVLRGKWVRENLLCETVPPLELVSVEAVLPDSDGSHTARQRVEQSIELNDTCMGCHQYMNELGKPFELYNHAGGLRVDDHGQAPDGSGWVQNAPDPGLNLQFDTPQDFVGALSESQHVKRCFLRHTFRYFAARDETPADACALAAMEQAYDGSGGSFVSALEALATHDTLLLRTHEESP